MLNYELAKQLKDAGFPQTSDLFYAQNETWEEEKQNYVVGNKKYRHSDTIWGMGEMRDNWCDIPTLSELIEACGEGFNGFYSLSHIKDSLGDRWRAKGEDDKDEQRHNWADGSTSEEAVAKLWLKLNEKK